MDPIHRNLAETAVQAWLVLWEAKCAKLNSTDEIFQEGSQRIRAAMDAANTLLLMGKDQDAEKVHQLVEFMVKNHGNAACSGLYCPNMCNGVYTHAMMLMMWMLA